MILKSKEQYVESIRKLNAEAYIRGKRISDVSKNGFTRLALQGIGHIYELSRNEKYANQISAYCSIHKSKEDLVNRVRAARLICQQTGVCTASRCCGWDAFNALWHTTYQIHSKSSTQ